MNMYVGRNNARERLIHMSRRYQHLLGSNQIWTFFWKFNKPLKIHPRIIRTLTSVKKAEIELYLETHSTSNNIYLNYRATKSGQKLS